MSIGTFGIGRNRSLLGAQIADGTEVINLSQTSTVWVHTDVSIQPGVGVPLYPQTSLTKVNSGPLYAVLDSGSTDIATVIVADGLANFDNPVAVAAAVATELLASGIPNVIKTQTIFNGQITAATSPKQFDISNVSEIDIYCLTSLSGPIPIGVEQTDANGQQVQLDTIIAGLTFMTVRIAAVGETLSVSYPSGSGHVTISITGSNREPQARIDFRQDQNPSALWQLGSTVMVAGSDYTMLPTGLVFSGICQGLYFLDATVGGTTVTGRIVLMDDSNAAICVIADTVEMYTGSGGTSRRVNKLIAMPPQSYNPVFQCRGTGGTASVNVNLVPATII